MRRFYWTVFWGTAFGFLWAVLYRINDNAMFAEWESTYQEHLALHKIQSEERLAKMAEEGIEFDTKPLSDANTVANVKL